MSPLAIILYAVIVTLLLTLVVIPRSRPSPAARWLLWAGVAIGAAALVTVLVLLA